MEHKRIFGLDVYLATAIKLVLLANALYLFQFKIPLFAQLAPVLGFFGIEIFLVLGGYWLYQGFKPVYVEGNFNLRTALRFTFSHLMWLLPMYYILLLVNIGLAYAMGYAIPDLWKYCLLVQNFASPIPAFFPESWPIPVLIATIILYPLLMLAFDVITAGNQKRAATPVVAVVMLLVFVWTKWLFNTTHEQLNVMDWEARIKTVLLYRIDAVAYGVLAAWLLERTVLMRLKWPLALLGLLGLLFFAVGVGYWRLDIGTHAFFWNVLYLPMASVVVALWLPLLSRWHKAPKILKVVCAKVAASAYACYLVHFSIVFLLLEHFFMTDLPSAGMLLLSGWGILYLLLCYGLGLGLHFGIEKPLRKRLKR